MNENLVWANSNTGMRAHAFLSVNEDGRLVAACRKSTTREADAFLYGIDKFSPLQRCGVCEKKWAAHLDRAEAAEAAEATQGIPAAAITRVLVRLGLEDDTDFTVEPIETGGRVIGTRVNIRNKRAKQAIRRNRVWIERRTEEEGFPFLVAVYTGPSGVWWPEVTNYGGVTAFDPDKPVADECRVTGNDPWAQLARLKEEWPEGTRVSGVDSEGVRRTGVVNGADWGWDSNLDHSNYRRVYVGVWWDERLGCWSVPRNRPFLDTLTRI